MKETEGARLLRRQHQSMLKLRAVYQAHLKALDSELSKVEALFVKNYPGLEPLVRGVSCEEVSQEQR